MICHEMSLNVMKLHDFSWNVMICYYMSWFVTKCHYMSRNVISCHELSCYAMQVNSLWVWPSFPFFEQMIMQKSQMYKRSAHCVHQRSQGALKNETYFWIYFKLTLLIPFWNTKYSFVHMLEYFCETSILQTFDCMPLLVYMWWWCTRAYNYTTKSIWTVQLHI